MGNKLGRRRHVIDEKYTRPQGLYHHKDVDQKKLKKLILESKLAPCYPGDEECICDLEECPICFLYYPSLNRSRCCMKGICTECFLQMKVPNSTRPTQCPFCKTSHYAVEYRGVKTKEEKGLEQIEEQRVIEAKIRIRQQELLDDEERMQKRQELDSGSRNTEAEGEDSSVNVPSSTSPVEGDEIVSSHESCSASMLRPPPPLRAHREDEFDLDLEDIMVIEAIWLSIQESGRNRTPTFADSVSSGQYMTEDRYVSPSMAPVAGPSSSSPSGGLACAIAALAERQQMSGESSVSTEGNGASSFNMVPTASRFYNRVESPNYPPAVTSADISSNCGITLARDDREWNVGHGSEVAEAGTSYASSGAMEDAGCSISTLPPPNQIIEGNLQNVPDPIVPESFEEQMMLAMALSLAEARAISNGPGVSWQ